MKKDTSRFAGFLLSFLFAVSGLPAQNVLFIGNSYTYGGEEAAVRDHGGVPKMVEAIAVSKGKKGVRCLGLTAPGRGWGFHLSNSTTYSTLKLKNWDLVVLQDYSTISTHLGDRSQFFYYGTALYHKIMAESKKTRIVLYETWARGKGSPFYTGTSARKSFVDAGEMTRELQTSYSELQQRLETIDPGEQVGLAHVGTAFARCLNEHPEIELYDPDHSHANREGSYLAALVIYGALFHESPHGATRTFSAFEINARDAENLQTVADEVAVQMPAP